MFLFFEHSSLPHGPFQIPSLHPAQCFIDLLPDALHSLSSNLLEDLNNQIGKSLHQKRKELEDLCGDLQYLLRKIVCLTEMTVRPSKAEG